jgi:metal-sulfur cluster biosynthetic enzyme
MARKKTIRKSPVAPPWMKDSWKSANRKPLGDFTMRDIDAIISEVRAETSSADYRPAKLSVTLTRQQVVWLKRLATSQNCSVEELVMNAVTAYSWDLPNLEEDRQYFTNAIAGNTKEMIREAKRLADYGAAQAKELGIKLGDANRIIHEGRRANRAKESAPKKLDK